MKSGASFAGFGLTPRFLLLLLAVVYLAGLEGADGQQQATNLRGLKESSSTEQGALLEMMGGDELEYEDENESVQEEASDKALTPSYHRETQQQLLGAWALCTTSSQCQNG